MQILPESGHFKGVPKGVKISQIRVLKGWQLCHYVLLTIKLGNVLPVVLRNRKGLMWGVAITTFGQ